MTNQEEQVECDICGEALDRAWPLGQVECRKCGLMPMCERCAAIHSCSVAESIKESHGPWEFVGFITVDSGTVQIGDPCYDYDAKDKRCWTLFCEKIKGPVTALAHKTGRHGKAVVVSSFGGDGTYPVYVKRGTENEIAQMKVDFTKQEGGGQ